MSAQPKPQLQQIYLSKNGTSVGPFSDQEIAGMKKSGELYDYTFIWDLASQQWKPIDPPPPPDAASASVASGEVAAHVPAPAPQAKPKKELKIPAIDAVCFNPVTVVSGQLAQVTEEGCEFVATGTEPGFTIRSRVTLNLLNPKTGKAMNVVAKLSAIRRQQGRWMLSLHWDECPEILL